MMVSKILTKRIFAGLLAASAVAVCVSARFSAAQSESSAKAASVPQPTLDYEFFKAHVEPIFLKKRWPDHARCYVCHEVSHHSGGPFSLAALSPGSSSWTEEQSRLNFEAASRVAIPGDPNSSIILLMPLAPEAGGAADTHQGGRQFTSKDDPDWKIMEAWVRGAKGSSWP